MDDLFFDLDDDALDDYARKYAPEEYRESDIKKEFCDRVEHIDNEILRLHKTISRIKEAYVEKDMDAVYDKCALLSKSLSKQASEVAWIPSDFGIYDNCTKKKGVIVKKREVSFIKLDSCLKIVLPELLPHRMYYDKHTKQIKYFFDYDEWHSGYMQAFQEEFASGKYNIIGEKVVLIYLHHVISSGRGVKDPDNFETKYMTDIITLFLLRDDTGKYVSQYSDMIEDFKEYTEIIICPQKFFPRFIQQKINGKGMV